MTDHCQTKTDEKLASIPGVQFFVSCIQVVTSNKKRKRSSGNKESEEPGEVPGSQTPGPDPAGNG